MIELLVVMAVIGILSVAMFPMAEISVQRSREEELKRALWEVRDAIDAYKKAFDAELIVRTEGASGYPTSLDVLVTGAESAKVPGKKLFFLRRVPRNPFADDGVAGAKSWGLRSFESPPERPRAGLDVYDVYVQSDRIGLNGVALRQW